MTTLHMETAGASDGARSPSAVGHLVRCAHASRGEALGFGKCPRCGVVHTALTVTCRGCGHSPIKTGRKAADRLCVQHGATLVYLIVCGSHAYGTAHDGSDIDVRGVFVPPWRSLLGLRSLDTLHSSADDVVLHSARKFVRLLAQGNPNILDWLFVPDDCLLIVHPAFLGNVRVHASKFITRRLHARFRGYAVSHMQKMTRGVTRDLGEKRKADVDAHGYSTKNAMHMIRLLRMGCEALETGEYRVRRPDVDELLTIRRGERSLADVQAEAASLLDRLDRAAEGSTLPEKPCDEALDEMLVGLVRDTLGPA